jgi:hypothetical protein
MLLDSKIKNAEFITPFAASQSREHGALAEVAM